MYTSFISVIRGWIELLVAKLEEDEAVFVDGTRNTRR